MRETTKSVDFDWKTSPGEVAQGLNEILRPLGVELYVFDHPLFCGEYRICARKVLTEMHNLTGDGGVAEENMIQNNENFGDVVFTPAGEEVVFTTAGAGEMDSLGVAISKKYGNGELLVGQKRTMLRFVRGTFNGDMHDGFRLVWQYAADDAVVGVFLPNDDREAPLALLRTPAPQHIQ